MRVKHLDDIIEGMDPEAFVVVEYPVTRCQNEHGRLPGIANVDDAEVLYNVVRYDECHKYTADEVRLRIIKDR